MDCRLGPASGNSVPRDRVAVLEPGAGVGAIGSAPAAPGRIVRYKSLGGGIYDAIVLSTRPDGRLNIETIIPPHSRVFLSRIVLAKDQASAERGEAFVP